MSGEVQRFDHFVVPVDDVLAGERFYTEVLGGQIGVMPSGAPARRGLSVSQLRAGFRPHTFFELAGKRVGVYLQCELRPKPANVYGSTTYSFETTPEHLDQLAETLAAQGIAHEGPVDDDDQPATRSLFFNDPAGNHYHVYVPRVPSSESTHGGGLTAVGYMRVEAPRLEASIRFYSDILGLAFVGIGQNRRLGAREATFRLPSGQLLLLVEQPWTPKGVESGWDARGVHLAFSVVRGGWETLIARIDAAGLPHGDTAPEGRRRDGDLDTYLSDPAGFRIQLVGDA